MDLDVYRPGDDHDTRCISLLLWSIAEEECAFPASFGHGRLLGSIVSSTDRPKQQ